MSKNNINNAKCESYKDLEAFMLKQIPRPKDKSQYEEINILRQEAIQRAKSLWQELISKNERFFKKDGFLEIEYLSDKKLFRRKPLGKGRPKQNETKKKRITVRLDNELRDILNNYCQINNIDESKAIREAIRELKYKY